MVDLTLKLSKIMNYYRNRNSFFYFNELYLTETKNSKKRKGPFRKPISINENVVIFLRLKNILKINMRETK